MTATRPVTLPFFFLLLLAACSSERERVSAQLRPLGSCADIADSARKTAIRDMERHLDAVRACALDRSCSGGGLEDAANPPPAGAGIDDGGATDHSETNNQVAGVDEADFVKNDDRYLYIVAGGALHIIDAWPAPEAHTVALAKIEGTARRLFVGEDRALVYSSLPLQGDPDAEMYGPWGRPRDCTYGYSCSFTGDGRPTKITVFDISDRAHPIVEREIWLSGSYVSARRIESSVHTVVSDPGPVFEGLDYWPEGLGGASSFAVDLAFDRLRKKNRRIILETPAEDLLPYIRELIHERTGPREVVRAGQCGAGYENSLADGAAITSVVSLDLTRPGDLSLTSIVSRPGAVYGSSEALYMAVPHEAGTAEAWYDGYDTEPELSSIHKFTLRPGPAGVQYRGSGVVKGRVLNQFALDEYEGDLRVATTSGHVPDPAVHSTLSVLREAGGRLDEIGRIDDIAPQEDIRSVRFEGGHGFIVTFKKTDPLFVLDLTSPQAPRVVGELHIPGFSTYMHLMDADHLLTIGYDADDQGDFAWFQGVLLQIFDVGDLADPMLAHKEVIGTRGSSSEALTNHLAFNYYPTRQALALPMTVCEGSAGGGIFGDTMTFSGLMVYRVTPADGFSLAGEVAHPPSENITCSNWWTDATSQVKRSVFMEDYVFSISESRVKVNAMDALATDLVEISLSNP